MNYNVLSATNGASQKHVTIDYTTKYGVVTIQGEILVCDREDGSLSYDIMDWEITHLNGDTRNHSTVWNALETFYSPTAILEVSTGIDAALIEVASELVSKSKTPQNAPQLPATDFGSMTMDQRIERIDWDAVRLVFERDFDFASNLQSALDEVSLDDAAEVEINNGYGRDFSVELSFDSREIAKEMKDAMADAIYEFCDDQAKVNATATAA